MAYTVSAIAKTVLGNERTHVFRVTTDSAEDTVDTALQWIDWHSISWIKCTDAAFSAYPNSGTTGTALAGKVGFSGVASGDIFFLTVYGH